MDFLLAEYHNDLASSVDALLTKADSPAVSRAWAAGDRAPAAKVFSQLADTGVFGLLIDDEHGGAGAGAVEMVVVAEVLGRHGVPGPLAETVAVAPTLLAGTDAADDLGAIAGGRLVSVAAAPWAPRAADADAASQMYLLADGTLSTAQITATHRTVDPARTVSEVCASDPVATEVNGTAAADLGALATGAQLLGLGDRMLSIASEYAVARKQFGRAIGSFQAVKHHLADVAIALEMARPLIHGAAVGVDGGAPEGTDVGRDISAAKVAAADAAYLASRHALQVLGAIGYTAEHDLSLYLTKTRALIGAWGTPAAHRARILETL
ncbi:MAG TPA: acyl-CoA dehydrogenase [Gordonia polyisoprenivorans]|uniref:acyl-CoA dehydrogenase n=1 Tax=Gordonia polyisoprenivorans TaxID=84595 RepID=UPI0003730014|nr:acyl-CoA dehydrogenase [Gordonia polyisoprenivorans]QUD83615.1 acyl-CoA dehydrogenase family protein [Gordonia polyisoprenivorans]HCS56873.1 acyl-CoA dehydrogenase [Gordonia polyisoprenivorans]